MVSGVLGGIARYIGWDPTVVRLAFVAFAFLVEFGWALVLYVVLAVVLPKDSEQEAQQPEQPPQPSGEAPDEARAER